MSKALLPTGGGVTVGPGVGVGVVGSVITTVVEFPGKQMPLKRKFMYNYFNLSLEISETHY